MELGPLLRSMRHHKGAFSLLVLEVGFGFVILVHALIYARYYRNFGRTVPGVPTDQMIVVQRRFLRPRPLERGRAEQRADLAALARLDGVEGVAATSTVPLPDATTFPMLVRVPGSGRTAMAWTLSATPGVIDAFGLRLVAGRPLDAAGATGDARPLLISRRLANQLFSLPEDALGRVVEGGPGARGTVVGVVENFALYGTGAPNWGAVAIAAGEPVTEQASTTLVRCRPDRRAQVAEAVQRALQANAAASADALTTVRPLVFDDLRFARISRGAVRVLAWTGFLIVAVTLAGSLALSSFFVAERTRQIGVRRALGARRRDIFAQFLLENFVLTTLGLGIGLALSFGLNRALLLMLSNIPLDGDLLALAAGIFLITALLSAVVPARRAAAIPPSAATRSV